MLAPCLDPQFAQHLNAFWRETAEFIRAWFLGLNACTIVLLIFAAFVFGAVVSIAADLTRRELSRDTERGFLVLAGMLLVCAGVWSI